MIPAPVYVPPGFWLEKVFSLASNGQIATSIFLAYCACKGRERRYLHDISPLGSLCREQRSFAFHAGKEGAR